MQNFASSKEQVPQLRNQNTLFAHNSAPSSSHHTSNGKIPSMVGLKQIVNPQPLLQNPGNRKGSTVTNSQHSSEMKGLNMNFSQGSIPINYAQQGIQFHNFQSHPFNQRSFSNSKLPQQKGSKNAVYEQPTKSNFIPEEALSNYVPYISAPTSYASSNNQNIGSTSCHHHINEIVQNNKNSFSPPKQMMNNQIANNQQSYHQVETPFTIFKQNFLKQKMTTQQAGSNFPYSTSNAQIMNSSANSSKNSLNVKRLKHPNSTTNGNQSTPKQVASPSPSHHAQFGPNNVMDKQSHLQSIERIKENINKKLVLPQPPQVDPQNQTAANVVSNVFKQNKTGTSNSEHKMNIGSDRNQQNVAQVNQNILLSINQSQSIRSKMNNNNSNSTSTNINSIINNNQSAFLHSKNLPNGQGETMSLNITQNSPNLNNFYISNSTKNNNNAQAINLNNSNSFSNNNSNNFKEEQKQNNSSTNIIFEKVKKRKMNNLSLGGQQQNLLQNQQQQLQNLIQSKSSQLHTPTTNSKDQFLSKTLSFSGHQNNFYSPNTYTKHQQSQQESSNAQNNTVGAIQSKLKHQKQADIQYNNNNPTFNTSNNHNFLSSHSAQKPVSSQQQTSDGMSSGNNTNIREAQEKEVQKSNKENMFINLATSQPPSEAPINILNLNNRSNNNNNNIHLNSNGGGVTSQSESQETGNSMPRTFNKFSQSLVQKQNQGEFALPKKDIFSPSHKGTCKLIMNKLDQFDIQNIENPIDHIIEIVSLLHLTMVDTPFDAVLGKFEENIAKVNCELRTREKQNQQKIGNKQNEIDILQREINSINVKIEKLNNQNYKKKTPQKVSQVTQTSPKKKKEKNNKNAVIQICDQNGNVQEVDTDKENDMLRDYILEQEKKVNVFKDKEGKMIKLLLAIKKRGVDIDDIYNAEILNEESADEVVKVNPLPNQLPLGGKKTKVDNNFFKKLDNDLAYADNSIVNDSDESSFGFYGKPSVQDQTIIIKQKSFKPKQIVKNKVVKQLESKLRLNLAELNHKNSDGDYEDNDEEKENRKFHKKILQTLNITQNELDKLQQQIQNDPSNLSNEQLYLVQQIHALQQEHEKQLKLKNKLQNKKQQESSSYSGDKDQILLNLNEDSSHSRRIILSDNILPPEAKNQISTISLRSNLEEKNVNNMESYQNKMNFQDDYGDGEDYEDNNNSSLNGSSRENQFYYIPK